MRVVFLGDSITYHWVDDARPDQGMGWWRARFVRERPENFGGIGDQTQNLLWRIDNGELAGRPKAAVILAGSTT